MPQVDDLGLRFIYSCDPIRLVDEHARTVFEATPDIAAERFRGGSQAIPFDLGWLTLIHERSDRARRRHYQHRFVWFDRGCMLKKVSRPFFFQDLGIEFAAGLAWASGGERLLISYGRNDCEAWIATVEAAEVRQILADVTPSK